MPYVVEEPIEERCYFERVDPSKQTWVVIKEAREGDHAQRDKLWGGVAIERDPDGNVAREVYNFPGPEIIAFECWTTFVDSNLLYAHKKLNKRGEVELDTEGKPIIITETMFKPGMAQSEFIRRFARLRPEIAKEWHDHVVRINPEWRRISDPDAEDTPGKN